MAKTKQEIQRDYEKRTGYAAQNKYLKEKSKRYVIQAMFATESDIISKLDSVGNTTAAIGKGFCIGSATLTSLAFIVSFIESWKKLVPSANISLADPKVLIGMLLGAMLPYLFSSLKAVAFSDNTGSIRISSYTIIQPPQHKNLKGF